MRFARTAFVVAFVASITTFVAAARASGWHDGDLIVRAPSLNGTTNALYDVDPTTGHGTELLTDYYWAGGANGFAYDAYRDAVLCCMSHPPIPYTAYKLWAVGSTGAAVAIPGFDGLFLRGITSVGDGRVYLQQDTAATPHLIEYIDANNAKHVLMDQTGLAPLDFAVEHMIYHAPSNSLITGNSAWTGNLCIPNSIAFHRIPLSADGSHVAGPITCASYATSSEVVMSLDLLPGGKVFATIDSTNYFQTKFLTVDPYTLGLTPFAQPTTSDINGGCWCDALGQALLLDDASNTLRLFHYGENDAGTLLAADVPLGDGYTGHSPKESIIEIHALGPSCFGIADEYGVGLYGTTGFVPELTSNGCPAVGSTATITITKALGGAPGLFIVGFAKSSAPFLGGTLLVTPFVTAPFTATGAPGVGGAGGIAIPATFTDPSWSGLGFYLQAAFADPGAIHGASLTNGLQIVIG